MMCTLTDILTFSLDLDHFRNLRSTLTHGFTKPDECPPRQTESVPDEKNGKKRPCPRKCSTDSDCLNDRKLCLCDGACGMSCIRPEKECPELPDPPHGQVHLEMIVVTHLYIYVESSGRFSIA